MKILKKLLSMLLVSMFTVMLISKPVAASEFEMEQKTNVIIKANVPDGFDEDIKVTLEYEETQVRASVTLTTENGYTKNLTVLSGNIFLANANFESIDKYDTDLEEKYSIEGGEVELIFNVIPAETIEDIEENTEIESSHGEEMEIDPLTGLPTPESVIKNFEKKVSFIEDDSNFDSFLAVYSGPMLKNAYMESDAMNTEESWNAMNETERFIYYISYRMPYMSMTRREFDNVNDFIEEELISQRQRLNQIENGDIVYEAIVDVWEWQYDYWQHTGSIFNFFNYYDGLNAGTPTESESEAVKLTEKEEMEEVKEEITKELNEETEKEDNPAVKWIKENWLTGTILIVAGVSFLVVHLISKKKNLSVGNEKE